MNWHCLILGWGVPLAVWLAVRLYRDSRVHSHVRRELPAAHPNQQGPRRGLIPTALPQAEHRRQDAGAASKKGTPGVSWHVAIKLYIGQRVGALVSREAPEPQPIQQVPRRSRRMLSQGVAGDGLVDRSRSVREALLKEQAERERLANDRVTETGTHY
jgi:hypothetical protein